MWSQGGRVRYMRKEIYLQLLAVNQVRWKLEFSTAHSMHACLLKECISNHTRNILVTYLNIIIVPNKLNCLFIYMLNYSIKS